MRVFSNTFVRRSVLRFSALSGVIVFAACGEGAVESTNREAAGSFGVLAVTYTHDWNSSADKSTVESAAQFVRYSHLTDGEVKRLLAFPLDPKTDLPAAIGQCETVDPLDATDDVGVFSQELAETTTLELLEAGDIAVKSGDDLFVMTTRHVPRLLPFVAGAVYGEVSFDSSGAPSRLDVKSQGSEFVDRFSTMAAPPKTPWLIAVAGDSPHEAEVRAHEPLSIQWTPDAVERARSVLYVEISRAEGGVSDSKIRCRLDDVGSFRLPDGLLAGFYPDFHPEGGQFTVELARVVERTIPARGLDKLELRVTSRDRATVQFGP